MELDQYFTKPKVATWCLHKLHKTLPDVSRKHFIEPSAGNGSFFSILPSYRRIGVDIQPLARGIEQADFLQWSPEQQDKTRYVVIGNPPFGHRSSLAIDFFNHAADMADTIAFIVPRHFQKYSVHSKLADGFQLIRDYDLQEDSFYTPNGKEFRVRCAFQIWTSKPTRHKNLRIITAPPTAHDDFDMYQYNNTPQALKVFKEDWEFAVPRQGFEDYSRRETEEKRCEKHKQWILFKPKTVAAFKRLWNFDFTRLARKNTMIYGFGKADVVMEYNRLFRA